MPKSSKPRRRCLVCGTTHPGKIHREECCIEGLCHLCSAPFLRESVPLVLLEEGGDCPQCLRRLPLWVDTWIRDYQPVCALCAILKDRRMAEKVIESHQSWVH
jgi:hypothetical protein